MKTTRMVTLLAVAIGLAGCEQDTGMIFGGAAPSTTGCQGGTHTAVGGGGQGGSGSTTTTTSSTGGSTSTTTSSGGAGGSTTTSTSTEPTCQEKACQNFELECGPVWFDCDGNGNDEVYQCGGCTYPAVCGGAGVQFECSDKCFSKYCPICQSQGLPSGACPVADCVSAYKFSPEGKPQFIGFGIGDCKNTTAPDGTAIKCCVSPF